jgi:hypothetical protein
VPTGRRFTARGSRPLHSQEHACEEQEREMMRDECALRTGGKNVPSGGSLRHG